MLSGVLTTTGLPGFDFHRNPFIVIWEVTRACALACVHCRADSIPRRDPRELTMEEGFRLIDQVCAFGEPPPLFVLTGGDPMRRPDLAELVRYAAAKRMIVAVTPSGTAAATRTRLRELKDAGLSRLAVSLDGPDAATHDAFRGVRGSYDWTMKIMQAAVELDLPLQINTTVSRITLPLVEAMARRVREFPLALWAVFFSFAPDAARPSIRSAPKSASRCSPTFTICHSQRPSASRPPKPRTFTA